MSEILKTTYYIEPIDNGDGTRSAGPTYRYRLVECAACSDTTLLIALQLWSGDEDSYDDDYPVYPAPPRSVSAAVPKIIQDAFTEARTSY